jgi:hypothetical protein
MRYLLLLAAVLLTGMIWLMRIAPQTMIERHIAAIASRRPAPEIPCASLVAQRPLVLLVLGQSNAANHGTGTSPRPPVNTVFRGHCFAEREPLAGGSGEGASLWPRVASSLGRPVVFAVAAVESTTIADWTKTGPLRRHLQSELQALGRSGPKVDLVLWQQGEADAKAGTTEAAYRKGLDALLALLDENGVHAPLVAALSTYCPGSDGRQVRQAIRRFAGEHGRLVEGPDTDLLQGAMRSGGCHFSEAGLQAAASAWAKTLRALAP